MSKKKKGRGTFAVGSRVRVRRGVRDPDHPDIPLGGWAGTVRETDSSGGERLCLVEWDEATLEAAHPVFTKRCERDGTEHETMWLADDDLEPDAGPPAPVEKATPVPRPLREDDEDDRVRSALGLTSDDPLPAVTEKTLRRYHTYLSQRLRFPFEAEASEETGPLESTRHAVKVTGLLDPDECDLDEFYGIICEVREGRRKFHLPLGELENAGGSGNARLVGDYAGWFWNHR